MRNRSNELSYAEQRYYLFCVANKLRNVLIKNQRDISANPKTTQNIERSLDKLRYTLEDLKRKRDPDFQRILQNCWYLKESSNPYLGRGTSHAPAIVIGEAFLDLTKYNLTDFAGRALGILDECFPMLLDQSTIRLPLVLGLEEYDSLLINYEGNLNHICQDAVIGIGLRAMQTMGTDRYRYLLAENADFDGMDLFQRFPGNSAQYDDSPYFDIFGNQSKGRGVLRTVADISRSLMDMMLDYDDGLDEDTMVLWSPNYMLTKEQEESMLDSFDNRSIKTLVVGQDRGHIHYEDYYGMRLTLTGKGDRYGVFVRNPSSHKANAAELNLNSWYVRLYKRPGKPTISSLHYYKDGI